VAVPVVPTFDDVELPADGVGELNPVFCPLWPAISRRPGSFAIICGVPVPATVPLPGTAPFEAADCEALDPALAEGAHPLEEPGVAA
jgi:hypothetical protein